MSAPTSEILRADRRLRRRVMLAAIGLVAFAVLILELGMPWLPAEFERQPPEVAVRALKLLMLAAFAPFIPLGVYLFSFGRRTVQAGRFPPPGAPVIIDTRVRQGRAARLRGGLLMLVGLVLTGLTLFAALVMPALVERSLLAGT